MIIGKMDKRITLQKLNLVEDGKGGWKPGPGGKWLDGDTIWAEFKTPKFSTEEIAGAICSVSLREIKIRYRPDVVKGWRIVYGTETMPVSHAYHPSRSETVLVVKEVVK